jgi:hypothetical protein
MERGKLGMMLKVKNSLEVLESFSSSIIILFRRLLSFFKYYYQNQTFDFLVGINLSNVGYQKKKYAIVNCFLRKHKIILRGNFPSGELKPDEYIYKKQGQK